MKALPILAVIAKYGWPIARELVAAAKDGRISCSEVVAMTEVLWPRDNTGARVEIKIPFMPKV